MVDDGKLKADQTFKHQRMGSHYSQGMESEFIVAPPRRKTVGFKETSSRRGEAAVSGFIAVEDVETNKSHSIFERASRVSGDFELQKSIGAKEKSPPQVDNDGDPGAPISDS